MIAQLMALADELEGNLRETLSSLPFRESIIGAGIDVDEYWEAAELTNQFRYFDEFFFGRRLYNARLRGTGFIEDELRSFLRAWRGRRSVVADFSFRPENWDNHCKFMGYPPGSSPVIFRVYLDHSLERMPLLDFPNQLLQQYPIIFELRKMPKIKAVTMPAMRSFLGRIFKRGRNKGISLGNAEWNTSGTLGGLLRGQRAGEIYLITCAHVAGHRGNGISVIRGRIRHPVGRVSTSLFPPRIQNDTQCSQTAMPGERCADVSAVHLDKPLGILAKCGDILGVQSIATEADLRTNDLVHFLGKQSGNVKARIGQLEIWQELDVRGERYCYRRMVELKPLTDNWYVREHLARPGDSGAWIVDEISGVPRWVGMLVAAEAPRAYMCLAETIIEKCEAELGPLAALPPEYFNDRM